MKQLERTTVWLWSLSGGVLSSFDGGMWASGNLDQPGRQFAGVLRAQAQDVRDVAKRELMESAGRKEIAMMAVRVCQGKAAVGFGQIRVRLPTSVPVLGNFHHCSCASGRPWLAGRPERA